MNAPTFQDVVAAQSLVSRHLPKTPLVRVASLSRLLDCDYYAKCENLQPVGAFKVRGGINLLGSLKEDEKRRGVVSASTGNHGQSLAYAGRIFGIRVVIYAPEVNVNPLKLQAMRDLGAEVRLFGRDFDEAREEVEGVAARDGMRYVHSANEPKLIAGVGTLALEVFDDLPEPDVIIAPVGAGSGACGTGIVARHLRPQTRVIGVQSDLAPAVWHAWKNRRLDPWPTMETVHEGLSTRVPFELTTSILWDVLDDFHLVSDEEINTAIGLLAQHAHLVAEGAGAASLAGTIKLREQLRGKTVVGILSGGNIPLDAYAAILGRRDSHS